MTQPTQTPAAAPETLTSADYEEVLADHRRLVRRLDVLLNGAAGAATQASLADLVAQVEREGLRAGAHTALAPAAPDLTAQAECARLKGKLHRILYQVLQDYVIPEDDINAVEFDAIFSRYSWEQLEQEWVTREAQAARTEGTAAARQEGSRG